MTRIKFYLLSAFLSLTLLACSQGADPEKNTDSSSQQSFKQPFKSMLVYPKKNKIADFTLVDHKLEKFNQDSFIGKWNLMFMGYTNCPDVCPMTLTDMTKIYQQLTPELKDKFQVLFLSVDPSRDNPEHIAKYIDYFDQDFVGITGEKKHIDTLVASVGGIYALNTEEGEYYTVDHTARIFLINPKGERYGMITSETMHNKDKALLISELETMALSKN
jgi:protein SCO1